MIKKWKTTEHGKLDISRNLKLDILMFADDVILLADSEDGLQRSVYQMQCISETYNLEISVTKTKIMAFVGKNHLRTKICLYNKPVEQVSSFKYLGYYLS